MTMLWALMMQAANLELADPDIVSECAVFRPVDVAESALRPENIAKCPVSRRRVLRYVPMPISYRFRSLASNVERNVRMSPITL